LEDIIKVDPPLVARILKVSNSAYYSPQQRICTIEESIIRIGFDALKYIALGQKVKDIFNKDKPIDGYSRILLWKHSVAVGLLGKLIYNKRFGSGGDNIYAAGLLHDIGIIAEDQLETEAFTETLLNVKPRKQNLYHIEEERLGYNHADLGQTILSHWNLPPELVAAIGCHHNPHVVGSEYSVFTSILYVADYICQEKGIGYCDMPFRDESAFHACLKVINLEPDLLDPIVEELELEMERIQEQGVFS
jgi:putative nucleotidyltransferase with HDIG domain